MRSKKPHALNVLGPFYVEDGCCTSCEVPKQFAPALFGEDDQHHCFVKQQPRTDAEADAMIRTMATQEFGCIRYRGEDEATVRRLVDADEGDQCDVARPLHVRAMRRDHASFEAAERSAPWTSQGVVERLANYLAKRERFTSKAVSGDQNAAVASLEVSWFQANFHRVEIRSDPKSGRWVLQHFGPPRLSDTLHDWLTADDAFDDVRWQTAEQWRSRGPSQPTPW
ncbi:MAG: hypothetical protein JWO36_5084 [Myxococcales bacterium]|nr:hypothetical protein [Myxococcales bacterium]